MKRYTIRYTSGPDDIFIKVFEHIADNIGEAIDEFRATCDFYGPMPQVNWVKL